MGKEILSKKAIEEVFKAMPHILKLPAAKFWFDYDREADVLYISFQRPQKATDSELLDDGVILRYRGDEMVGLTILDASKRDQQSVGTSKSN